MKLNKRQLKRIIRAEKRKLQESGDIYPRPQHPMVAQALEDQADPLKRLEMAIEQAMADLSEAEVLDFLEAFCSSY